MKDKLVVINKYKDLIEKYSSYDLIYPRKYYYLKDLLENILFNNLRELYIINSISNRNIRVTRKEGLIGSFKYLNYLFSRINNLDILSDKRYKVLYIDMEVIYKYLVGWLNSDRK